MEQKDFTEKEKQIEIYKFLGIDQEIDWSDDTDGIYKGTIFEFKKDISNLDKVLFQAIKYLSFKRIRGKDVPDTIALVDERSEEIYFYHSQDFRDEIHHVYVGAPSQGNNKARFNINEFKKINFHEDGIKKVREIIDNSSFIKIDIDQNCVIGWAKRYYANVKFFKTEDKKKDSWKKQMFDQLRNPTCDCFKYINPWKGKEEDFEYIMDCLNDPLNKKELGAFYTPKQYCKIATNLVKEAIKKIGNGNYVIIDRCGGTGNLEDPENGFTKEMLSKTIIATYEVKEWEVLVEKLGDKVLSIIPSDTSSNENGLLREGNALNVDVFEECKKYVNDPNCTVILFENPPYRDSSAECGTTNLSKTKDSFVSSNMKKEKGGWNVNNISTVREIANNFIWSGFKYYLKKKNDQYILFSPIKYWKSIWLVDSFFNKGYLFNRSHFHATEGGISCIWWTNKAANHNGRNYPSDNDVISLKPIDILKDGTTKEFDEIQIKRIKKLQTEYYDKSSKTGFAFMQNNSVIPSYQHANLVNSLTGGLNERSGFTRGFWINEQNLLESIVPWVSNYYPCKTFIEKDVLMKTADGGDKFKSDFELQKRCLLWACLTQKNKCLSFSELQPGQKNSEQLLNQICLDKRSISWKLLKKLELEGKINFDEADNELISIWREIENILKKESKYNANFYYGSHQVEIELNEKNIVEIGGKKITQYLNKKLNTKLVSLKQALSEYFSLKISPLLTKYSLIK